MARNYIEFRVHLIDNADRVEALDVADALQDHLVDQLNDASEVFTQEVTYEVIFDGKALQGVGMWVIYAVGSKVIKAMFANEEEAKDFHRKEGGDLVFVPKGMSLL